MDDIDKNMNKQIEDEKIPFEEVIDSHKIFQMASSSVPYEPEVIDAIQEEDQNSEEYSDQFE